MATPPTEQAYQPPLTTRERETAQLAYDGLTNRQISRRLGISLRNVDHVLTRIYEKLGIHSRTQLTPDHLT